MSNNNFHQKICKKCQVARLSNREIEGTLDHSREKIVIFRHFSGYTLARFSVHLTSRLHEMLHSSFKLTVIFFFLKIFRSKSDNFFRFPSNFR